MRESIGNAFTCVKKILMTLAKNESRFIGTMFEAQVIMRLKIQEQSELNFVSRIIQSRYIGIGNYPLSEANGDLTLADNETR
jgi:hypothetical protein